MSQPQTREELLAAWKAKKVAAGSGSSTGVGGALQHKKHENSLQQPRLTKPAPGLPPRLVRGPALDKEKAGHARPTSQQQEGGAGGGGGRAPIAVAPAPDSVRKVFANGQQQQEMLQEFGELQGQLQALKRESIRPSISGVGGAAAPARHHAPLHATSASRPPEAAAARATQPAAESRSQAPAGARAGRPPAAQPPQPLAQPLAAPSRQPQPKAATAQLQQQQAQPAEVQPEEQQLQPEPVQQAVDSNLDLSASNLAGLPPAPPPSIAASAPSVAGGGVSGLAARLESLKRESLRPSVMGAGAQGVHFEAAGQVDTQALSKLAVQLFDDAQFQRTYEKGMKGKLTRSVDGATADTKISELASMVNMLRRGMQLMQAKTTEFVTAACKFEKEVGQQLESVKLSSESDKRAMQVELANSRKEAAAASSQLKHSLANWQGELDKAKGDSNRLKRELERVEGERQRLQEHARKLESSKQSLEAEIDQMRKAVRQEVSGLKLEQNSAKQMAYEVREAAERKQQQLSEALAAAEARCKQLEEQAEVAQIAEQAAQRSVGKLEKQLAELQAQHRELEEKHKELQTEHATKQQEHQKVVRDSAFMIEELQNWQEKAEALLVKLELEQQAHAATQTERAAALAAQTGLQEQQGALKAAAEADRAAAQQREEALLAEKSQLKAAVQSVTRERDELQAMVQQAAAEMQAVQQRAEEGSSQQASLRAEVGRLAAQVQQLGAELEAERSAAAQEAKEKGEKLERLEGELDALQECTIGLGAGDQREMLTRMLSKIAALESAVAAAEAKRRDVHNQLVELKGNIRVFCRIRPNPRSAVQCLPDGVSVRLAGPDGKEHTFGYDKVFKPEASQAGVFEEVSDLVQSALDGFKVCLFSYGQTGAGKTHTMQGSRSYEGQGIIPRAICKILDSVGKLRDQGWEYQLEASFIEVYNEQLRDLLADTQPGRREAGKIQENNAIQHQPNGGHTLVLGAARLPIGSESDAEAITRKAAAARAVEATAMNAVSSRSHSVFMLYITGRHEASGTVLQGSLNLVDLAGSERLARSQAEGQRAKEACNINKSLSSLGDVFQALATRSPHIPYRNSKLTHLLQPCLGGSGKTLMFVNVNPEPESVQETLCSLRFAAKVNQCETAAKGGAQRHISSSSTEWGSGVAALTGRPSLAPTNAEARRMSLAPGSLKRKPGVPPASSAPRGVPRPRLG